MPCSAVSLSIATIISIISVALLAIAFSTDNWISYEVKRDNVKVSFSSLREEKFCPFLLQFETTQKMKSFQTSVQECALLLKTCSPFTYNI